MPSTLSEVIHSPLVHTRLLVKLATATACHSFPNPSERIYTDTFYPKYNVACIVFVKT